MKPIANGQNYFVTKNENETAPSCILSVMLGIHLSQLLQPCINLLRVKCVLTGAGNGSLRGTKTRDVRPIAAGLGTDRHAAVL